MVCTLRPLGGSDLRTSHETEHLNLPKRVRGIFVPYVDVLVGGLQQGVSICRLQHRSAIASNFKGHTDLRRQ